MTSCEIHKWLRRPAAVRLSGVPPLLFILCLLPSCKQQEAAPPPPAEPAVHALDKLPLEQLRVTLKGHPGDWRQDTPMARGAPEPPKSLPLPEDARIIGLPSLAEITLGKATLKDSLAGRRSRREFSASPLQLAELSFLLWSAQGVTHGDGFRTTPSGGGRYPLETFIAVRQIDSLAPGIYRYLPATHQLLLVREDPAIATRLQQACYNNSAVGSAAAVMIWAAVPARTEWKYGYISHKMIAIEAGHACQNLYLACESIGAGTCAMCGYHQPAVDALIGVDGKDTFTIYLAPFGKPAG